MEGNLLNFPSTVYDRLGGWYITQRRKKEDLRLLLGWIRKDLALTRLRIPPGAIIEILVLKLASTVFNTKTFRNPRGEHQENQASQNY